MIQATGNDPSSILRAATASNFLRKDVLEKKLPPKRPEQSIHDHDANSSEPSALNLVLGRHVPVCPVAGLQLQRSIRFTLAMQTHGVEVERNTLRTLWYVRGSV
jgi:hypothetical protein